MFLSKYIQNKKSEKGMALILVLGAIVILTTMAVEFAYNTNVNYHLARNEVDRLKAMYLAKSAYRFMQVELKLDRTFRSIIQSNNLAQFLGSNANLPLCQQFPLSTGLIRAVFMGDGAGLMEEGAEEFSQGMVSLSDQSEASEFLNFEGDFDGECIDESTKINLNYFTLVDPLQKVVDGNNKYDEYKLTLLSFLNKEEYRNVFESENLVVGDIVRNLADWVDSNESINELGTVEAGPEIALYEKLEAKYPIKNGKLTSLEEAFLIEGVTDEWFTPLKQYFTIYGDAKINICNASELVIQNVIRRYFVDNPNLPPIRLDDPETMNNLIAAISEGCSMGGMGNQLAAQVGASLDSAIGALGGAATADEQGAPQASRGGFASYISSSPRYFSLLLTGVVGEITVRIKAVLDINEADPKRWKLLYWKVY